MKKWLSLIMAIVMLFSLTACNNTPAVSDDSSSVTKAPAMQTNDSLWYSEDAGVRGRIWLGMTEKELYDVLNDYNIEITFANFSLERDESAL